MGQQTWLQKNRIYLWGVAVVLVILYIVAFLITPTETAVDYSGQAAAYSASDESWSQTRAVELHGTLTKYVIGKDSFRGTLTVSGVEGLDGTLTLAMTRENGRWTGGFETAGGQPARTGVYGVGADRDFRNVAVALREDGQMDGGFDAGTAVFLAPGASGRYAALALFREYWGAQADPVSAQ